MSQWPIIVAIVVLLFYLNIDIMSYVPDIFRTFVKTVPVVLFLIDVIATIFIILDHTEDA
jgi:hypothetical protein